MFMKNNGVHMFMKNNRPAIEKLFLWKEEGRLAMRIFLIPSNLPFYGLSTLDSGRFERCESSAEPSLTVTLNEDCLEDSIIDQISSLLSAHIKLVHIREHVGDFSPEDYSLCAHLLRDSTIGYFRTVGQLADANVSSIIEITSHTKELDLSVHDEDLHLSDSVAFITQLMSMKLTRVNLTHFYSSVFGFPLSFWENFVNAQLANGSFECVEISGEFEENNRGFKEKYTKAPIDLPDDISIFSLKWIKADAK